MKKLHTFRKLTCTLSTAALLLSLSACDQAEPVAYKIPKETREVNLPTADATEATPAAPAPGQTKTEPSTGMQVLPGMAEAANAAGTILYNTPAGWQDLPASGIRKAHLRVTDANGTADVTITTFPGDVGGTLANINRWRGQIGLDPATAEQLPEFTKPYPIFNHGALYVTLDGGIDSILAAIMPFHGYTWFIKFQGSSSTVFDNEIAFQQLLNSIEMEGHAH